MRREENGSREEEKVGGGGGGGEGEGEKEEEGGWIRKEREGRSVRVNSFAGPSRE